jgi:hypothetical protein
MEEMLAAQTEEERMVLPASGDQIRVVPVYHPEAISEPANDAPGLAPPKLTYRNGPLLTSVQVYTLFWGRAWQSAPLKGLADGVNKFFDFILTSSLIDELGEYSVPGMKIGHGKHIGSIAIAAPAPAKTVSDNAIRHLLQQEIATNHAVPHPTPNTLYFVYLPPGVAVVAGGGSSCKVFCGYHDSINGKIFYAVMPYPGCAGCTGSLSVLDALTSTSSHELCEAITDAVPGSGWYDDSHGEIGDICAWQTKKVGSDTVQLEWSNKRNKCV